MQKSTLVDILFESTQSSSPHKKPTTGQNTLLSTATKHFQQTFHRLEQSNRPNKIIKITQFNSSIMIGEEKMMQSGGNISISLSPQKNFNIKKICQSKNKVIINAQRIIEGQLKKRERNIQYNFNKCEKFKQPIEKILVTTRCNFKKQLANIDTLTNTMFFQDDGMKQKCTEEALNLFFSGQRKQVNLSKDMLLQTKKCPRPNSHREMSGRVLQLGNSLSNFDQIQQSPTKKVGSPRKSYSRHIQQQKKYQQMIQKQKRQMLEMKKQLNKNYAKPFNPPQGVTAFSYIIYQADAKKSKLLRKLSLRREQNPQSLESRKALINSYKVIVSFNPRTAVEIASLTKIMTCILALDIAKKYDLKLNKQCITIGIFEQNIGGTSAKIQKGQTYSIQQLLYGLMLPSGNDASLAISVWGGKLLLQKQATKKDLLGSTASSEGQCSLRKKDCYQRFIQQMNKKAAQLNMDKTRYANSHGLCNIENKSCAFDLALLCQYAMGNKKFREIVSCKNYETAISYEVQEQALKEPLSPIGFKRQNSKGMASSVDLEEICGNGLGHCSNEIMINQQQDQTANIRTIQWQNTHSLVQQKPNLYIGIKTGITSSAGPCLASFIQINNKRYIIIVLNCKTMKYRFKDTQNLRKWLFTKEQIKFKQQKQPQRALQSNQQPLQCDVLQQQIQFD